MYYPKFILFLISIYLLDMLVVLNITHMQKTCIDQITITVHVKQE